MRHLILLNFFLFLLSCSPKVVVDAPPLQYSYMPTLLNIDSIQPYNLDDTNRVVDSTLEDFASIPIDGGKLIGPDKDTLNLPAGVLISDRKAMLYPFYKASWERQKTEVYYTKYLLSEYYSKAKTAEILYQKEIVKLEKKAERSWLERNIGYIGFGAGLATSILTCFALYSGTNYLK
jgi:hypothetical protein